MNLKEIMHITTQNELDDFIKRHFNSYALQKRVSIDKIKNHWKYVGDDESNASTIDMLSSGEKGIIERITNGIDAVIEKQKNKHQIHVANNMLNIIEKAYPKYHDNLVKVLSGTGQSNTIYDAANQIVVAVNDGSKKNTPTFDILDYGTGIHGDSFIETILSLHGGNKIKEAQSYMIGAFGQGGSTSLSFAYATIIISKFANEFFFTIVKKIQLEGMKNHVYVYLTDNGSILKAKGSYNHDNNYIERWAKSESGTFIRMIDLEIAKRYRERDITKPRMLGDYFNIELFDVKFPIQLLERRKYFVEETYGHQDRYSYGSKLKLLASKKNYQSNYSGSIEIFHNNHPYKIDFYIILPSSKEDWGNDYKCRETYEMFNLHEKPIFFTVNGQYINGENYTKLNNRGLSFLKYRLLVHIDLDVLGNEKYQFFTTDRSRIRNTDLTEGFLDKVITEISNNKSIRDINSIIGEMQIEQGLDPDDLQKLTEDIKDSYLDFLKPKSKKKFRTGKSFHVNQNPINYNDFIEDIIITNTKEYYYKNEICRIMLKTDAYKDINKNCKISLFVNKKEKYVDDVSFMNGVIQYSLSDLNPGEYSIHCIYFNNGDMKESNQYHFEILDEIEEVEENVTIRNLDLRVKEVKTAELIVKIIKNDVERYIEINYCISHPLLDDIYYGLSDNQIQNFKKIIIPQICLFALFNEEIYETLEPEKRNQIILSYIKVQIKTTNIIDK